MLPPVEHTAPLFLASCLVLYVSEHLSMYGLTCWFLCKFSFTLPSHLCGHLVQNDRNAMHVAATGGNIEVIKSLLPYFGARVHDKDDCAFTMLHWAAQEGQSQVAHYLINELHMSLKDKDKVCGLPLENLLQGHGLQVSCMCVRVSSC